MKVAFPAVRPVRFDPMVNSVLGSEPLEVEAAFSDKHNWIDLQPEWLDSATDGLASALSFLSDDAIRFYLPAYLVADLAGSLHRVDPTFQLVHGFDNMSRNARIWPRKTETWTDFARARWDGLTQPQAIAVVHYLEWRIEQNNIEIEYEIVQALAAYWYTRAAGLQPRLES